MMRLASRTAALAWTVMLVVVRPIGAHGQIVVNHGALDAQQPNVVHVMTGIEYGFVAGVGYSRGVAIGARTLLLSAALTAPWADADAHDYDAHIGASIDVVVRDRLRLVGGLGGNLRGTTNVLSRMQSVGADGVLLAGWWSPRWFVAGEGGYDGAIATHIEHTDYYRALVHPDARDGWYVDTGANIRLGLAGGVSLGRYDIVLRAGKSRDRGGNRHLLPAYAALGLNVKL